jgi:hypothetical protein
LREKDRGLPDSLPPFRNEEERIQVRPEVYVEGGFFVQEDELAGVCLTFFGGKTAVVKGIFEVI